jgi:hypothetical protein
MSDRRLVDSPTTPPVPLVACNVYTPRGGQIEQPALKEYVFESFGLAYEPGNHAGHLRHFLRRRLSFCAWPPVVSCAAFVTLFACFYFLETTTPVAVSSFGVFGAYHGGRSTA